MPWRRGEEEHFKPKHGHSAHHIDPRARRKLAQAKLSQRAIGVIMEALVKNKPIFTRGNENPLTLAKKVFAVAERIKRPRDEVTIHSMEGLVQKHDMRRTYVKHGNHVVPKPGARSAHD